MDWKQKNKISIKNECTHDTEILRTKERDGWQCVRNDVFIIIRKDLKQTFFTAKSHVHPNRIYIEFCCVTYLLYSLFYTKKKRLNTQLHQEWWNTEWK